VTVYKLKQCITLSEIRKLDNKIYSQAAQKTIHPNIKVFFKRFNYCFNKECNQNLQIFNNKRQYSKIIQQNKSKFRTYSITIR